MPVRYTPSYATRFSRLAFQVCNANTCQNCIHQPLPRVSYAHHTIISVSVEFVIYARKIKKYCVCVRSEAVFVVYAMQPGCSAVYMRTTICAQHSTVSFCYPNISKRRMNAHTFLSPFLYLTRYVFFSPFPSRSHLLDGHQPLCLVPAGSRVSSGAIPRRKRPRRRRRKPRQRHRQLFL